MPTKPHRDPKQNEQQHHHGSTPIVHEGNPRVLKDTYKVEDSVSILFIGFPTPEKTVDDECVRHNKWKANHREYEHDVQ